MIATMSRRRDWFFVDIQTGTPLVGLPGYEWDPGRGCPRVHRNLLALLDSAEVRKALAPTAQSSENWALRDAWAAERGFKFRTTQHQAIDFELARGGVLLADDMRLGKGHPIGTRLLTPTGWRAVEDLRVTDQVVGSNGRACNVTGVFRRGVLPVFRVTFSDGAAISVDGDHLWHVWDMNAWARGGCHRVRATRDLVGDLVYGNFGNRKWRIPLVSPVEFPDADLALDPYVLGVLLGDGSLSTGAVRFTPGDEDVPREVALRLPAGTRLSRGAEQKDRATSWGIVGIDRRYNPARDALRALGLMGLKSEQKFVPDAYLFASVAQRLALLQGLLDTDGELSTGRAEHVGFSSSSPMLADAVKFLVESLGGVVRVGYKAAPRYTYRGEICIGLPSHRLTIAMPSGLSPFRARQGHAGRSKFLPSRLIASIEPAGEAEVICISVDAPDQLYVTEHCIVTHNTASALGAHNPSDGPLVVIAPLSTRAVWLGWIRRMWPNTPIGVMTGSKIDLELLNRPIVFGHYDILHKWQSIRPLGTFIVDEAHLVSNPNTKRGTAAATIAGMAKRRLALTGTPIWNRPVALWGVVSLIAPGALGNFYDFANRYGAPSPTAYGPRWEGISCEAELRSRMSEVMFRRRWVDVAEDLPPITRSVIVADVSDADRRRLDILAAKLKSERTNTAGNLAAYRRQVTGTKLGTVVAEAQRIMDRGEPVVIWTWHKDYAEKIASALGERGVMIHGEIPADLREARITHWKKQPAHALVATMAVAQVGLDFSHARIAIFGEIDYTPAILAQAEMRTFAPTRGMDIIFVVANHLVDQRIIRALVNKLAAQDQLGVGAANDAIDALRDAVMGPEDPGDLDRMLEDMIASMA